MKIHFDNVAQYGTGPGTFAGRLANSLSELGHEITLDATGAVVSLVFIEPSGRQLANKVVQRLDGIWFRPQDFHSKNANIKALYDCADAVIWQSKFDRKMSTRHWGAPGSKRQHGCVLPEPVDAVIHNGIELKPVTQITIPALENMRATYDQIYVCSSNWHAQKRLKANVELFERLRATSHSNSCLIVLGNNPDHRASGPHVFYAGSVGPEAYLQIYSVANWMLHLAWADHCPNVVIEALSQGTPVVCSETGGTKELIGEYGIVLKESIPYDYELFDYEKPPTVDVNQISSLPNRTQLNYGSIADIDIKNVAKKYIEIFERVL